MAKRYDDHVLLDVTYLDEHHSGDSFWVRHEGTKYNIPTWAVHDDSSIYYNCSAKSGILIVQEKLAVDRGILDATAPTRLGIPLKRHRLPEKPEMMPEELLQRMQDALEAADPWVLANDPDPMLAYPVDTPIALFEGTHAEANVVFAAQAPAFVRQLLEENQRLREWVAKALKTQERRRRR